MNPNKNPLIMINGGSGTEKRAVSTALEEKLRNYYKFSLCDTRKKLDKQEYTQKDILMRMYVEIFQTLKDEKGVIIHSNYKSNKERDITYFTAISNSVSVLLIQCISNEETIGSKILEDIAQDFENNKNDHVSWITYDPHTSEVNEMLIRKELRDFSSQIIDLLQYNKPQN
jgi:predicted kinase